MHMILKHYHQIFTKTKNTKKKKKKKKKKEKKKRVTFAVSDWCDVIKKTEDVGQGSVKPWKT